jgi:hypothetical protein
MSTQSVLGSPDTRHEGDTTGSNADSVAQALVPGSKAT